MTSWRFVPRVQMLFTMTLTEAGTPALQNYVRERLLGRGGSSKVYLARCTRGRLCGRRVALKMVRCLHNVNPDMIQV